MDWTDETPRAIRETRVPDLRSVPRIHPQPAVIHDDLRRPDTVRRVLPAAPSRGERTHTDAHVAQIPPVTVEKSIHGDYVFRSTKTGERLGSEAYPTLCDILTARLFGHPPTMHHRVRWLGHTYIVRRYPGEILPMYEEVRDDSSHTIRSNDYRTMRLVASALMAQLEGKTP